MLLILLTETKWQIIIQLVAEYAHFKKNICCHHYCSLSSFLLNPYLNPVSEYLHLFLSFSFSMIDFSVF